MKRLAVLLILAGVALTASPAFADGDPTICVDDFGVRLLDTEGSRVGPWVDAAIPAGDYTVTMISGDFAHAEDSDPTQTEEQWVLITSNSDLIGPTDDLPDDATSMATTLKVTLQADIVQVRAQHLSGTGNVNSVEPLSACFSPTSTGSEPEPGDSVPLIPVPELEPEDEPEEPPTDDSSTPVDEPVENPDDDSPVPTIPLPDDEEPDADPGEDEPGAVEDDPAPADEEVPGEEPGPESDPVEGQDDDAPEELARTGNEARDRAAGGIVAILTGMGLLGWNDRKYGRAE